MLGDDPDGRCVYTPVRVHVRDECLFVFIIICGIGPNKFSITQIKPSTEILLNKTKRVMTGTGY